MHLSVHEASVGRIYTNNLISEQNIQKKHAHLANAPSQPPFRSAWVGVGEGRRGPFPLTFPCPGIQESQRPQMYKDVQTSSIVQTQPVRHISHVGAKAARHFSFWMSEIAT